MEFSELEEKTDFPILDFNGLRNDRPLLISPLIFLARLPVERAARARAREREKKAGLHLYKTRLEKGTFSFLRSYTCKKLEYERDRV